MKTKVLKYPPHPNRPYIRRWIIAGLYTLLIFLFLPIFPRVWDFLAISYPLYFRVLNLLILPSLVLLFVAYQLYIKERHTPLYWLGNSVIIISSLILVYFFCPYSSERFHVPEYIILTVLVYRAFSLRIMSISVYAMVLVYTFFIGFMDEIIQWQLPNRVGEIKDVYINGLSAFFGICLVAGFSWKKYVARERVLQYRKRIFGMLLIILFGQFTFVFFSFL